MAQEFRLTLDAKPEGNPGDVVKVNPAGDALEYAPESGGGATLDTNAADIGVETFGASAAAGSTGKAADAGHVHAMPAAPAVPAAAATVVGPDAFGAAAAVGVSTDYARADHDHGLPAAPSGSALYTMRDRLVASGGESGITLGATPVGNSPIIWKQAGGTGAPVILWPTVDYTISGATITLNSSLAAGDVILDYYQTTNAAAGAASLVLGAYHTVVLADSPWGYWRLQETSGTSLADASGHSRPMTLSGTAHTLNQTGPVVDDGGKAIAWSTATGQAKTTATIASSTATLEVWVKVAALPATATTLIGLGDTSAWDKDLYLNPNGSLDWYTYGGGPDDLITASGTIAVGNWYHIVATVSATAKAIYVNGVSKASNAVGTSYSGAEAVNLRWSNQAAYAGAVQLAEPAVYTTALTLARAQAHYNAR